MNYSTTLLMFNLASEKLLTHALCQLLIAFYCTFFITLLRDMEVLLHVQRVAMAKDKLCTNKSCLWFLMWFLMSSFQMIFFFWIGNIRPLPQCHVYSDAHNLQTLSRKLKYNEEVYSFPYFQTIKLNFHRIYIQVPAFIYLVSTQIGFPAH